MNAVEIYNSQKSIYKNWDYRCLAPDSHKDPGKWRSYDMPAYRAADSREAMEKVATYKYDRHFNNWIDHKVMKDFTQDPMKTWRKAYGFSWALPVPRLGKNELLELCGVQFLKRFSAKFVKFSAKFESLNVQFIFIACK